MYGFGEMIDFDLKNKKFRLTNNTCQGNTHFRYGTMQELQAINMKVKEMRMDINKFETDKNVGNKNEVL